MNKCSYGDKLNGPGAMKLINSDILSLTGSALVIFIAVFVFISLWKKYQVGKLFLLPQDSGSPFRLQSFPESKHQKNHKVGHQNIDDIFSSEIPATSIVEQEKRKGNDEEQKKITDAIFRAQEKERNDIGAELHDNVNQILVGTNLLLAMIRSEPGKADEYVNECIENVELAISETRKIAHRLVAPDADGESLTQQVERLANTMLEKAGLKTIILTGAFSEELLNQDQKLVIYRILQEQCTNIIKYADAKTAVIILNTRNNKLHLRIVDDGKGVNKSNPAEGIGLRNIASRVKILEGTVKIETDSGDGFMLDIRFPLDNDIV